MQHERFGGMRNDTAKTPTEEELRIAEKAYEEADPTTYSTLPIRNALEEKGIVEKYKYHILTDGIDTFYALPNSRNPKTQQVVQRLLKGIVNVSDLVSLSEGERTEYASKESPLHKIQKGTPDDEIYADIALLTDLFYDSDHSYYPKDPRGYGIPQHNLTYAEGKVSYHDFSEVSISERTTRVNSTHETLATLEYELDKVNQLIERFEGEDGKEFFFAILNDAGAAMRTLFPVVFEGVKTSTASDEQYLYTVFMSRLKKLSELLNATISRKHEGAEDAKEVAS